MWYGDMGAWGWWMMVAGGVVWLGFLAAIAAVASAALRPAQERAGSDPRPAPLEILKVRYARGELSREELERSKGDLA